MITPQPCSSCGVMLPQGAAACPNCGAPVNSQGGQAGYPGAQTGPGGYTGQQGGQAGYPGAQTGPGGYTGQQGGQAGYPGAQPGPTGYPGAQPGTAGYPGAQPGPAGYAGAQPGATGYPPQPGGAGYQPGAQPGGMPQPLYTQPGYAPTPAGGNRFRNRRSCLGGVGVVAVILIVGVIIGAILGGPTYAKVVVPSTLNGESQSNDPTIQTVLSSIQTQLSSGSHVTNAVTAAYGPTPDLILMAAARYDAQLDVTGTINNNSSGLQDSNGNNINESNATQVTENGHTYYCWEVALGSSQNAEMCEWVDGNVNGIVLDINSTNANHVAKIADEARTKSEQK